MSEDKIEIRSDRLKVEMAQPGTIYQGTRFDWTAFITQVTLDDQHTFCVPESLQAGQGTGGMGLCNEFGIDQCIGYDEAQPGEVFPKLGVGVLVRDDKPYNFSRPYPVQARFPIRVEAEVDRVTFQVDPVPARGYAARLTKTLSVAGRTLLVEYHLENVGEKAIATNEYCHNFINVDHNLLGPDYRLRFPYTLELDDISGMMGGFVPKWMRWLPKALLKSLIQSSTNQMQSNLNLDGTDLTLRQMPKDPFYVRFLGFGETDAPQWELTHIPSGVGLREIDDFTPTRVAVWGLTHVISAEIFTEIKLEPGQSARWTRRYECFTGEEGSV